jgi:hypothetical protein
MTMARINDGPLSMNTVDEWFEAAGLADFDEHSLDDQAVEEINAAIDTWMAGDTDDEAAGRRLDDAGDGNEIERDREEST